MSEPPIDPDILEQTRQEIRALAREVSELSNSNLTPDTYFQRFLHATISCLAAHGGAVWTPDESGKLRILCETNLRSTEMSAGGEDQRRHDHLLQSIANDAKSQIMLPYSGSENAGNPTPYLLVLVPLLSDAGVEGIVEVLQRPGASLDVQRGYLRFLGQMCKLAGAWLSNYKLRQLTNRHSLWQKVDAFSRSIHGSLDLRETAFVIANEARLVLECDRVAVAVRRQGKLWIEAISGQDTLNRRSATVGLLDTLIRRVAATGTPLWYYGTAEELPPQIDEALQEYVDESHATTLGVIPLFRPQPTSTNELSDSEDSWTAPDREVIAGLVVEQIKDATSLVALKQGTEVVSEHAARALTNADDHGSLFLMPLWRAIGSSRIVLAGRNLPRTLAVAGILLALVVAALLIPMDFNLEAPGELQPVDRRDVFAGIEGVVLQVHVDAGDPVTRGQPLVTLRNTDLMVQIERVLGELQVVGEQILGHQRRLLDSAESTAFDQALWATELTQYRRQQTSLHAQHQLLLDRKKQLVITSPIAGKVISWDVRRQLRNRPVLPGQVLLTIANPDNDWELLVAMPEDDIGYVTQAQADIKPDLDVTYVLATSPGEHQVGHVRRVDLISEDDSNQGRIVKIAVAIDKTTSSQYRPGATATAEIHCGRRSIAFVWLHDVIEFVQRKMLF